MTSAPVYLFRVVVPTRDQFCDFYPSQLAAALDAERRFPDSPPAQTTCLSR